MRLAATVEGPFFKMCRKTFWTRMKAYGAEAGIPSFKATCHSLKHTAGRLGYLGGMGVAELQTYLGHRSGASSMVYIQAGEQEAATAFGAVFGEMQ
jgi:integrase